MFKKFVALMFILPSIGFAQTWADRFSMKGDLRVRDEQITDFANSAGTVKEPNERNRLRLRARLQVGAKINDNTEAVMRLATGDTTAANTVSTNQDLTTYGAKKDFNLDLAYANHRPTENSQIWLGKTPLPYYQPGTSDLLFDTDLTPEGLSYKGQCKCESVTSFLNIGTWLLNERHDSTTPTNQTDVTLVGADLGVQGKTEDLNWTAGLGYYNYANIKDTVAGTLAKGNTVDGTGATSTYHYKYEIQRLFAEFGFSALGLPIGLFADHATNIDPVTDKYAQLVGIKIGKLKEAGTWQAAVDHRSLDKDSTLGALVDGDSGGGGTNIVSTRYNFQYQWGDGVVVGATYIVSRRLITTYDIAYNRALLDFNFQF